MTSTTACFLSVFIVAFLLIACACGVLFRYIRTLCSVALVSIFAACPATAAWLIFTWATR